jgi:hypothetical protein
VLSQGSVVVTSKYAAHESTSYLSGTLNVSNLIYISHHTSSQEDIPPTDLEVSWASSTGGGDLKYKFAARQYDCWLSFVGGPKPSLHSRTKVKCTACTSCPYICRRGFIQKSVTAGHNFLASENFSV